MSRMHSVTRSRSRVMSFILLGSLLTLTACETEKPPEPVAEVTVPKVETPPEVSAPIKYAALSPDSPTTPLGKFPVSADLEKEASSTIAMENLETELDRLEAEIASDAN